MMFLYSIGDESQILFAFSAIAFIPALLITLTSVKETPLVLNEQENLPLLGKLKN
jgi:hypothetical protein